MMKATDQERIQQLISDYGPDNPPHLPLGFGDYVSLLWRLDRSAESVHRVSYYYDCADALAAALGIGKLPVHRIAHDAAPGEISATLANVPFRSEKRLDDAHNRYAAIEYLMRIRCDILRIGAYRETWVVGWPGRGISDNALRERVFSVLAAAHGNPFVHFSRLLLVFDIVLEELLTGERNRPAHDLETLVHAYDYPDPFSERVRNLYRASFDEV